MRKEEKWRLRVLNIYYYNAFMRLDKEREVERLAKVYKETNKERKEWRALVQRQKNEKRKRAVADINKKKYTHKWMARCAYLKLLSATTFIQCCYKQLRARKEL